MGHRHMGAAVSTAAPTRPSNRIAVTVLGLITLLLGGVYAALGGQLILGGAGWFAQPSGDPWVQVIALGGIVPATIILLGIAFLVQGLLGLLGGSGVLLRRPWGRILTFILAVLAILLGLAWVSGGEAADIALGAAQVLFGILAFVILIRKGAEFFRPQA